MSAFTDYFVRLKNTKINKRKTKSVLIRVLKITLKENNNNKKHVLFEELLRIKKIFLVLFD